MSSHSYPYNSSCPEILKIHPSSPFWHLPTVHTDGNLKMSSTGNPYKSSCPEILKNRLSSPFWHLPKVHADGNRKISSSGYPYNSSCPDILKSLFPVPFGTWLKSILTEIGKCPPLAIHIIPHVWISSNPSFQSQSL